MAQTALITGGAGAIAAALSRRLLERGFDLLLVDIDEDRMAAAMAHAPGRIRTHRADLTRPDELEEVAALIAATPDLTLFVNNAGVVRPGNYAELPYADVALQMDVNLIAPMRLTHAAAARFKTAHQGVHSVDRVGRRSRGPSGKRCLQRLEVRTAGPPDCAGPGA